MKRCSGCGREMRPRTISKTDAPNTVAVGARGLCMSCIAKAGGTPAPAPVSIDSACVLVRTDLRPSTYRALERYAREHRTTVGAVLSLIADRAVQPKTRRPRVGDDVDARIRELNAQGLSDNKIAKQLGIAQSTVSARRRRMRIESPTPRRGGRLRAA